MGFGGYNKLYTILLLGFIIISIMNTCNGQGAGAPPIPSTTTSTHKPTIKPTSASANDKRTACKNCSTESGYAKLLCYFCVIAANFENEKNAPSTPKGSE